MGKRSLGICSIAVQSTRRPLWFPAERPDEAVLELDVTGAPLLVFRHAGHGRVNLVYRRADGHIGWIDPPAIEKDAH